MKHFILTGTKILKVFALACGILVVILFPCRARAQVSFGDPLINVTFGAGSSTFSGPLDSLLGTTTYSYTGGWPENGQYAIVNNSGRPQGGWLASKDRTTFNGYFMLVNASTQSDIFFTKTITGLCGGTRYRFGAYVKNVLTSAAGLSPNIKFIIETISGVPLGDYETGPIPGGDDIWHEASRNFVAPASGEPIVLKMINNVNNSGGRAGNDLAIDDITFRPEGPEVNISFTSGAGIVGLCEGSTRNLTITTSTTLPGGYVQKLQRRLNNGGWTDIGSPTTSGTFSITTLPTAGRYRYRLVSGGVGGIDSPKCVVASNELAVNVVAYPKPKIKASPISCVQSEVVFTDEKGDATDSCYWLFGDGSTSTSLSPGHTYRAPGNYTVKLVVTNATGCRADTVYFPVHISRLPEAAFNHSTPDCINRAVVFKDTSVPVESTIKTWIWNFDDGTIDTLTTNQPFQHLFTAVRTYNVTLTVQTAYGCSASTLKQIVINPLPKAAFNLPPSCVNDNVTFINNSTIPDGTESQLTYQWDFGDNTPKQFLKNGTHRYAGYGDYNVTLIVTSGKGCTDTLTQKFRVNGGSPVADFVLVSGKSICIDHEVLIRNRSNVTAFGDVTRVEIFYDYAHKQMPDVIDNNPYPDKLYRYLYPSVSTAQAIKHEIRMLAYSGTVCVSNFKVDSVTTFPAPQLDFQLPAEVCQNIGILTLTATDLGAFGVPGTAVFTGKGVTGNRFNPLAAGTGVVQIQCIYTYNNGTGCADTVTRNVRVRASPTVQPGVDVRILEGASIRLQAFATGNNLKYQWTPATGLSNTTVPDPVVTGEATDIVYTVRVTNDENCVDSAEFKVVTLKYLTVPNTFTPNGDGINDLWEIKNLGDYSGCTVDVFNRYGQKVFAAVGYTTPWDGRMQSGDLPAGVYYYIINPKHGRKVTSGYVTILR